MNFHVGQSMNVPKGSIESVRGEKANELGNLYRVVGE